MPAWRNLVWFGVVASVIAWALAWSTGQSAAVVMVFIALASVLFAYKAAVGMRIALVGLMVAGMAMFLASVYFMFWVLLPGQQASAFDLVALSVLPMVASAVLLVGAFAGYRHATAS
jgi:hypothetical protein